MQKRRIKETAAEIISTDSVGTFAQFLNDRKIAKKYWPLIIVDIIDSKGIKDRSSIYSMIKDNINDLLADGESFGQLLNKLQYDGYGFLKIQETLLLQDVDSRKLKCVYKEMRTSKDASIRESCATILSIIGRREPDYLFQEIKNSAPVTIEKVIFLKALSMACFRPFRNVNFSLTRQIFNFVTKSIYETEEIAYYACLVAIRLMDLDKTFYHFIKS